MSLDDTAIVYVGTYTRTEPHVQGKAEGIYVYRMDRASGAIEHLSTATGVINPSFIVVDAARRYLYAVQEVTENEGQPGGAVSAFAIDPRTGALTLINHQPTHGANPCYVGLDRSGRYALVANYSGGSVTVLPIGSDGALGPAMARYTRQVTLAWSIFFGAMALASTALFFGAPVSVWSTFANFFTGPLIALMFIAEYAVRRRVLPDVEHAGIVAGVQAFWKTPR